MDLSSEKAELKVEAVADKTNETIELNEEPKKTFDKEEFAYLNNPGFSSEAFKIEIKNLPKHYGYGELKKMVNVTCGLDCSKIKTPRKNSPFGFLCFRNDEGKFQAKFSYLHKLIILLNVS